MLFKHPCVTLALVKDNKVLFRNIHRFLRHLQRIWPLSLASVRNITAMGCTVASMITRERSIGHIASVRVATPDSPATSLSSPIRWRRRVKEERDQTLANAGSIPRRRNLIIRVLDPSIHQAGQLRAERNGIGADIENLHRSSAQPTVYVRSLHAKIGDLIPSIM
jgi:hypothetical protein